MTDALYWNWSFSKILSFSGLFVRPSSCHVLLRCNGHIISQINACHSERLMLVNGCRKTLRLTDNAGMYSNSRARHIHTVNSSRTGWGIIKKWSRLAFLATKITNSITKKKGFDSWDFINFVSDWMGKQNDYDGNILDFTDLT